MLQDVNTSSGSDSSCNGKVEKYLTERNLSINVLLILDNVSCHPDALKFTHPTVEVVFLSPNTTLLIQPLVQDEISAFKCRYTRHTYSCIADMMTKDPTLTVLQCWKNYNIAQ
ncbi:hypothetical protein PR048_033650 [Dryococelus australis]|uniref:DDE-1 domain-containing protein n=1 Tax=Dryococelus australis TaxID=614101 RepID=A0ABQ9G3Q0_9NEOP|nr:hypothetical protein PR048_033650 [Dryococelus australis]